MPSAAPLFLGLDLSTQQLKAVVIDGNCSVAHREAVNFSRDLPQFGTEDGVLCEGQSATSPVSLWLSALDLLLSRLASSITLHDIVAISGTAQQHGTVYWTEEAEKRLKDMKKDESFEKGLQGTFARELCPIWMDSSTGDYVDKFDALIPNLNAISGSKAYHRFSGPQIAKIFDKERDVYDKTNRISLISSFVPSLFLGYVAPIDLTDACGTNLLDIEKRDWSDRCLRVVVGDDSDQVEKLRHKLGTPVSTQTILGNISNYLIEAHGMNPECKVTAFTGDNPSSMSDLNVVEGDVIVSLGTSDTAIFVSRQFTPLQLGHLFLHPTVDGQFITLICYKNGSLTRERIRKRLGMSWDEVATALEGTTAGNEGNIGIYFDLDEIEPRVRAGDYRWDSTGKRVESFEDKIELRALLESQCLHLRSNCPSSVNRLVLTGGASANVSIRQMLSDVFDCPVYTVPVADSAAQGGAKRAKYLYDAPSAPYQDYFVSEFTLVAQPVKKNVGMYATMLDMYRERERNLLTTNAH